MQLKISATLISLVLLLSSSVTYSNTLKDSAAIGSLSEKFIKMIESGNIASAYDLLSRYVTATDEEFENIKNKALSNTEMIQAELGKPLSSHLLKRENIGEHFEKHAFIIKYKKAAIVWQISWYQPSSGWQVMAVNFNANVDPYYIEMK